MVWNKDNPFLVLLVKQVARRLNVPINIKDKEFQVIYTIALNSINDRDFLSKIKLLYAIKSDKQITQEETKEEIFEVEIESEENPILSPIFKDSLKNNR